MKWRIALLDGLVFVLLFLGWIGKMFAPDSRKAALGVLLLGVLLWKRYRRESHWMKWTRPFFARLTRSSFRWRMYALGFVFALSVVIFRSLALGFSAFDVGIFQQILWSLSHGHGFHSSMSRAGNFLLDHLPPSLVVLTPFYRLLGSWPGLPGVLSVVMLYGGGAAWIWLAERLPGSHAHRRGLVAAVSLVVLFFFQSLWGNWEWGFHENHVGFFFLSWAMAFHYSRKNSHQVSGAFPLTLFALLFASGAKETYLLHVGVLAIVFAFSSGQKPLHRAAFVLLGVVSFKSFFIYAQMPKHAEKNYVSGYYGYLGANLKEMLSTLVQNPRRVIEVVGGKEISKYLLGLLSGVAFLPFVLARRREGFLLLALATPLGLAVIAQYAGLRNFNMHYVLEVWPMLVVAGVLALGARVLPRARTARRWAYVWIFLTFFSFRAQPLRALIHDVPESFRLSEVRHAFNSLAPEDVVMADDRGGPWTANRLWVLTWWNTLEGLEGRCPTVFAFSAPKGADEVNRRMNEMNELIKLCPVSEQKEPQLFFESTPERGGWKFFRLRSPGESST